MVAHYQWTHNLTQLAWSEGQQAAAGRLLGLHPSDESVEPLQWLVRMTAPCSIVLVIMATLRSRCGHYIFVPFLSSSFFPRLISAVAGWMSTMVWP